MKTVTFTIDKAKLSFINHDLKRVTEPGAFRVMVGKLEAAFDCK
jgi:beta-glucosidase